MADPIVERIAQAVKAQLETVTVAGGYNVTVAEVVRPTRVGDFVPRDYLVVLGQDDPEIDEDLSVPGNPPRITWRQPFTVGLIVKPSEKSGVPVDQLLNVFRADVEKALMADKTWGGLALGDYTELGAPVYASVRGETDEYDSVWVTLNVVYRTPDDDPYSVG